MSSINKLLFLGMIIFTYKALSEQDKFSLRKTISQKIDKYKPKIIEIIDLIDSYNKEPTAIRQEKIDFQAKLNELSKSIDEIDLAEINSDLDDIVNFKKTSVRKIEAKTVKEKTVVTQKRKNTSKKNSSSKKK